MLKRYDAGLSIFNAIIEKKLNQWARDARASLFETVIPKMDEISTFIAIDTVSIPGYKIGVCGLCKAPKSLTFDCEFSITFENLADNSTLTIEMSTSKGYDDQYGFSDKLDIFNTDKWLRFVTGALVGYSPTHENTIAKPGTATIAKS